MRRALIVVSAALAALATALPAIAATPTYNGTVGPGFTIEGRYEQKDMRLHFTACSLCGAPKRVGAASSVLFPT